MPKKRVTKIDPKEKLSPYLDYQSNKNKRKSQSKTQNKLSASLANLRSERKSALVKRLGLIVGISVIALIGLGFYISPLNDVVSVKVEGGRDLPLAELVKTSGIKTSDKVIDHLVDSRGVNHKVKQKYSEVEHINIGVNHLNQLVLKVNEYQTIGYIKKGNKYCKILAHGKLGTQLLPWSKVSPDKPVFIGYNHDMSLNQSLALFNSLPSGFQSQIKLLSGNTRRKSQVIFVMKDGNVVIGNVSTLKRKLKYYNEIKAKATKDSLIDLEVGAYSRPLTVKEKRIYGLT
ncbi:cell division protein FtsQ/DivIB [Lactobacillus xylocopicola]|uniref:Cell division protein DivIB n=1 Tax=Lactobacillus xylocopicola TaxID=2976676 RepID=A0ABM8BGK5_9LACO|nr:cell division protein FtsQ/DivIB [Lactobacillus xylocopicola]BDR60399.1 cell division protein DivIB [Lactobacillus xylocopicola]